MANKLNFREEQFPSYFHDFRVFIFGADVTDHVSDSLSWQMAERDGQNTSSFVLNNAFEKWIITDDNLKNKWRTESGGYDESAKRQIFFNKKKDQKQDKNTSALKYPGIPSPDGSITESGRVIFHKMDPVRIFVHNPLTTKDEWIPVFCGYIENYDVSLDYITGDSSISLSCVDIREALLQKLRIATNLVGRIQQTNDLRDPVTGKIITESQASAINKQTGARDEKGNIVPGKSQSTLGEVVNIGIFDDVFLQPAEGLNEALANKSFESIIEEMILGTVQKIGNSSTKKKGVGFIEKGKSKFSGLGISRKGWPTYDPDRGNLEEWYANCLLGFDKGDFRTLKEVNSIGSQTLPGGHYSPHGSKITLNILLPKEGTRASNLVEFSYETQPEFQLDWSTKLEKIQELCKNIDYQFWVNGFGDLIFEFPMYDFTPDKFGEFKTVLTFSGHIINEGSTPEASEITNMIVATGGFAAENEKSISADGIGGIPTVIIICPVLMERMGVISKNISIPYLATRKEKKQDGTTRDLSEADIIPRLTEHAKLEMQKEWVRANSLSLKTSYRPFLLPNKPVLSVESKRMGLIWSVENSMSLFGECETNMTLKYIRTSRKKNGKEEYVLISGSPDMPISYNKLFGFGGSEVDGVVSK